MCHSTRRGPTVQVVAVSGPDAGHALPIIAVAKALSERGHDVVVATGPDWEDGCEADGLAWLELPMLEARKQDADFGYRIWGRAAEMAPPLADKLAPLAPDVLVVDTLTRAGAFAADLLGVPWVEVAPQFLYDPSPDVPPVGLGARPPRTPLGRLDHARLRRSQRSSLAEGRELRDRMRRRIGLPAGGDPVLRLLATLPALEYPRSDWPADTFVAGPLVWEPHWPRLAPPEGDGPVVAVTDSTASTVDQSLVVHALRGLAGSELRVVATTSRDLDGPVPDRLVIGRGSHAALVEEVDVVVCPGGHGTVVKALAAGVPVIVAPIQGDQRETGTRVEVAGAGLSVRWGPWFGRRLAKAVHRVVADTSYHRAAARIAETARGLGPDRAARLIETATSSRRSSSRTAVAGRR